MNTIMFCITVTNGQLKQLATGQSPVTHVSLILLLTVLDKKLKVTKSTHSNTTFPSRRQHRQIFCQLQSYAFDATSLFQTTHMVHVHWNAAQGCQNRPATGAFHLLFRILQQLLQMLVGQFEAWYRRNKMKIARLLFGWNLLLKNLLTTLNAPHDLGHFHCVASWLFCTMWCSFKHVYLQEERLSRFLFIKKTTLN